MRSPGGGGGRPFSQLVPRKRDDAPSELLLGRDAADDEPAPSSVGVPVEKVLDGASVGRARIARVLDLDGDDLPAILRHPAEYTPLFAACRSLNGRVEAPGVRLCGIAHSARMPRAERGPATKAPATAGSVSCSCTPCSRAGCRTGTAPPRRCAER